MCVGWEVFINTCHHHLYLLPIGRIHVRDTDGFIQRTIFSEKFSCSSFANDQAVERCQWVGSVTLYYGDGKYFIQVRFSPDDFLRKHNLFSSNVVNTGGHAEEAEA